MVLPSTTRLEHEVTLRGEVEGRMVGDIVLDTGCSRTMVRKELGRLWRDGQ